jgi:quinoprotein glucose dehydrogenase
MRRIESDVCIIGGGISAALLAQKLAQLRPGLSITVVEAGRKIFDFENRAQYRQRWLEYGENPWPGDLVRDLDAKGVVSRTMAVGGSALHWGGVTNRFSEEDLRLRSLYGLAVDWPLDWDDLERHYVLAERALGVSASRARAPRIAAPRLSHTHAALLQSEDPQGLGGESSLPFGHAQARTPRSTMGARSASGAIPARSAPRGRYSRTSRPPASSGEADRPPDEMLVRLVLHDRSARWSRRAADSGTGSRLFDFDLRHRLGYAWSSHLLLLSAEPRFRAASPTRRVSWAAASQAIRSGRQVELDLSSAG